MLLDEAAAYFADLSPSLGLIKKGALPATPNKILVVRQYQAGPSDLGFGAPGVKFEYPGLQILARGEPGDELEPTQRINRAYLAGAQVQAKTLSGVKHLIWLPQQPPFVLERDEAQRVVMAVNFIVQKEPSFS